MTAAELAAALEATASGDGWQARCPAHEDHRASLSIHAGDDGRVLLHCFAGCAPEAIVSAIGITLADLFPEGGGGRPSPAATLQPCNTPDAPCRPTPRRSACRLPASRPSGCPRLPTTIDRQSGSRIAARTGVTMDRCGFGWPLRKDREGDQRFAWEARIEALPVWARPFGRGPHPQVCRDSGRRVRLSHLLVLESSRRWPAWRRVLAGRLVAALRRHRHDLRRDRAGCGRGRRARAVIVGSDPRSRSARPDQRTQGRQRAPSRGSRSLPGSLERGARGGRAVG